ncbi:hypothetical protein V8E36_000882 [Tilletia maclaganii]
MAPNSPTKASAARAATFNNNNTAGSTHTRSTSTTANKSSSTTTTSSRVLRNPKSSSTLSRAKSSGTGAGSGGDASTATTTDESYFSLTSSSTLSSSSRAPSRHGTTAASGAGLGGAGRDAARETRSRTRAALQNNTNRPMPSQRGATTAPKGGAAEETGTSASAKAASKASMGSMSPPLPSSSTPSTSPALVSSASLAFGGVSGGGGRVKAQAKALESVPSGGLASSATCGIISSSAAAAHPGAPSLQHKSSTSSLLRAAGGVGVAAALVGTGGGAAAGLVVEGVGAKVRAGVAKKLAPSKLSCFEVEDTEGVKAYLRIRPSPQENKEYAEPYIQVLNETQVLMKPPREAGGHTSTIRARVHAASPPTKYTFTRVFAPTIPAALTSPTLSSPKKPSATAATSTTTTNDQASFFQHTTLPLVKNLLSGESGLIFTYGVTNSGKSYTVLGGGRKNEAGILPRALDVVFNSIQGRQIDDSLGQIRPRGLVGVEIVPPGAGEDGTDASAGSAAGGGEPNTTVKGSAASGRPFVVPASANQRRNATPIGRLASSSSAVSAGSPPSGISTSTTITPAAAAAAAAAPMPVYDSEPTTIPIDKNYRYSVWVSFVEVYNEKLFDLLDVAVGDLPGSNAGAGAVAGGSGSGSASARSSVASVASGAGTQVKGSGGLAASFGLPRSDSMRGSNWSIAASPASERGSGSGEYLQPSPVPQQQQHITLNRRPLTLKNDPNPNAGGKYVAGLSEHRVSSAQEAQGLLQRGTENRVVFGTLANRMSSRSHGVFTIKVIREHAGEAAAARKAGARLPERVFYTSRLSIVDLAGSERASNTGLMSGERLKEAGNINKSLMCLGQCLETIRKNQARMASLIPVPMSVDSAFGGGTSPGAVGGTPSMKRRLSVVPFRHSKLTELFQSFFPGSDATSGGAGGARSSGMLGGGGGPGGAGRAVMIVNANPYDTGYDENSHVMRFSAVAKDVQTLSRGHGLPVPVYSNAVGGAGGGNSVPSSVSVPAFGGSVGRGFIPPIRFAPDPPLPGRAGAAMSAAAGSAARIPVPSSSPSKRAQPMAAGAGVSGARGVAGATATGGAATGSGGRGGVPTAAGTAGPDPIEIGSEGPEVTIVEISDDEDDEDSDAFVDMLVEKHEELRQRLHECEVNAYLIEERVRAEMAEQMEVRMREMERMYMDRLMNDAAASEAFMNRKLDLLAGELDRERMRSGRTSPIKRSSATSSKNADGDPMTPTQARVASALPEEVSYDVSAAEVEDSLALDEDEEEEEEEDDSEDLTVDDDEEEEEDEKEEEDESLGVIHSRRRTPAGGNHQDDDEDDDDELADAQAGQKEGHSVYLPA